MSRFLVGLIRLYQIVIARFILRRAVSRRPARSMRGRPCSSMARCAVVGWPSRESCGAIRGIPVALILFPEFLKRHGHAAHRSSPRLHGFVVPAARRLAAAARRPQPAPARGDDGACRNATQPARSRARYRRRAGRSRSRRYPFPPAPQAEHSGRGRSRRGRDRSHPGRDQHRRRGLAPPRIAQAGRQRGLEEAIPAAG